MRVLICGGRDFNDFQLFNQTMGKIEGNLDGAIYLRRCNIKGLEIKTQKSPVNGRPKHKTDWKVHDRY